MSNKQLQVLSYFLNSKKKYTKISYKIKKYYIYYLYNIFYLNKKLVYFESLTKLKYKTHNPYMPIIDTYMLTIIKYLRHTITTNLFVYLLIKLHIKELINLLWQISCLKNIKIIYNTDSLVNLNNYFNIFIFKKKHINKIIKNYLSYQKIDIILSDNYYLPPQISEFTINISNRSYNNSSNSSLFTYILYSIRYNNYYNLS